MSKQLTIGDVSRRTGLPATTIRFYEEQGIVPPPRRTEAGYRLYSVTDLRRLRLARRARVLGLSLSDVRALVDHAFASECADFADQVLELVAVQRAELERRIADLEALKAELDDVDRHVRHVQASAQPGQRVANCAFCPIIDEEGGERHEGEGEGDDDPVDRRRPAPRH